MSSLTGRLLVAAPSLEDPNFRRSVVLLLDHDGDGAVGVVLNRPSGTDLAEVMPQWALQVSGPAELFVGGPVGEDRAVGLAVLGDGEQPDGFQPVSGRVGLLDLDTDADDILGRVVGARVFAGYAGWGSGQLEEELAEGAWFVLDALPGDAVTDDPGALWRMVLRRQPDRLAWLAHFPDDPSQN
jgi:putative transcriptional regulator